MRNLSKFLGYLVVALVLIGLVLVLGFKPEWLDWITPFFEGYSGEMLIGTVVVAVIFLVPQFGVTFLNWTKKVFKVEDQEAHQMVIVLLTGFTAVILAITGTFVDGLPFTFGNLVFFISEAYVLSQITYKRIFK